MKPLSILLFLILFAPLGIFAQFIYEFESDPDSVTVLMNGELQGKTPLKVKLPWNEFAAEGYSFEFKKEGYLSQTFEVKEKPRLIRNYKKMTLEKEVVHFTLDENSPMIEFDKLLAEFPEGKVIGEAKQGSLSKQLTWEGFSRIGSETFTVRTYDVLGTAGFNTQAKESVQLFADEKRTKKSARYVLGAKATHLWIDSKGLNAYGYGTITSKTTITIEWQVFDRTLNKVVLKGESKGIDESKYASESSSGPLLAAYGDALTNFLKSGSLYEMVKGSAQEPTSAKTDAPDSTVATTLVRSITLPAFENSPAMIQYATQSCVTISTDAGHGSGVIISDKGLILTAAHVVDGINRLQIVFASGIELEAKVLKQDETHDIALLQVVGSGYKPLPLGKGMTLGLGEEIVTIGTPGDLELGQSVSKGILSGKRKHEEIVYLQTDLAVSPGNSGGPLLNSKGEIIGIVQRKLIGNGIEGINFALPIETVMKQLNIAVEK